MKKILLALVVLAFMATPAVAGNQPEFDAVGCDATNFFIDNVLKAVCANSVYFDKNINLLSDFTKKMVDGKEVAGPEGFTTTAGQLWPDPCFDVTATNPGNEFPVRAGCTYKSALTDPWNEAIYTWKIVLQKKPESDIDLNIRDCVLKHNEFDVWGESEQTGRYRAPWGQLIFVESANPAVTVTAAPGPFATPGFTKPFGLDARLMPGLGLVSLDEALYTSKSLFEESLVMKLPATGGFNQAGDGEYNLKQGDIITITVTIPPNNTVDLFYGKDNVMLKYIGIVGTEYTGNECKSGSTCGGCETPVTI